MDGKQYDSNIMINIVNIDLSKQTVLEKSKLYDEYQLSHKNGPR